MARLKARPLRRCSKPRYPTKPEALADADLLRKHVPVAWLGSREIGGVLGIALAMQVGGCREGAGPVGKAGMTDTTSAVVAPLFVHGIGETGNPFSGSAILGIVGPAFGLSEEHAVQIITDELLMGRLDPCQRDVTLNDVVISGKEETLGYDWLSDQWDVYRRDVKGPLSLELVDPQHRVGIKYVAREDYGPLGGSTEAGSADLKSIAVAVSKEIGKHGRGLYVGMFYEPVSDGPLVRELWAGEPAEDGRITWSRVDHPDSSAGVREPVSEEELLRRQVRDFVEWLKGQGVI